MPILPRPYLSLLMAFAPVFSKRIWRHTQVLVAGAILAPGKRTVTAVLSVMGLKDNKHFQNYHRVLNRAVWSSLQVSRILLAILVSTFVPSGPVVVGGDDTIERRWGAKIQARGIYRDPVRSSHSHTVKASGLRWLSLMLLVPIPWAKRVWALPFLSVLAPSERYYQGKKRSPKKLTDWARQAFLQVRRWLPERQLVAVVDSSFAAIELLAKMQGLSQPLCMVSRFRLDAALYEPAPLRWPHQRGRPRCKGERLPTLKQVLNLPGRCWQRVKVHNWYGKGKRELDILSATAIWYHPGKPPLPIRWVLVRDPLAKFRPQALLCTQVAADPVQIIQWFVIRWQLEVTFAEVRAHLGLETQRQWSYLAIARTTPALLGLFSLVTLLANVSAQEGKLSARQTAWYAKPLPTFSDALAVVRQQLWYQLCFRTSPLNRDVAKLPYALLAQLTGELANAA